MSTPRHQPRQGANKPPGDDPDREFDFDTADMVRAIEGGHAELIGDFLYHQARVMTLVGDMLDPEGHSEFQLKPVRRRKGKPKSQKQANLEGNIYRDLRFARVRLGGKLEAAISEVGKKHGRSRSTVLRIWGKYEKKRSRTNSRN
jgi:hypothetical protein